MSAITSRHHAAKATSLVSFLVFPRALRQPRMPLHSWSFARRERTEPRLLISPRHATFPSSATEHIGTASSYCPEYKWVDGAESLAKYLPGGYHPVMIDDVLSERYLVVDKLGYGGYSTVWLALDVYTKQYVAVKIGIADSYPREMGILRALTAHSTSSPHLGCSSIPLLLDEFELHGANGGHACHTMPPALCNLREISFSRLFPIKVARTLAYGLTLVVSYVHSRGYVHGGLYSQCK